MFFVDGLGGTEKTYLYCALLANIRSRGMIALAIATSGVAATILPGGRTAHSRFDIPLQTSETTTTNMSKQSGGAKLIVWDEAPTANRQTIELVDGSFRDIMDVNEPFGGKVMIFGGDFRQVLSVVPKSTRAETINASLIKSYLWPHMKTIHLTRNMRARRDPTFNDFLIRVENREENTIKYDLILLPDQMIVNFYSDSSVEDCLIEEIFPSLNENENCGKYMTERAILASRNEYVDKLNDLMIHKFPSESKDFLSFDITEDDTNNYYQEEYLNTLTPNGLPPHRFVINYIDLVF
ncbi:uncharacterized protein LOC129903620 [Solanum dulcamara]|uniref:uncharacterized protein LOC129903620 n=1 Tax=Solanum dulcamara TaxID=45834 RepID=UPI0024868F3B|nr:uncharacterized protein LOC129903620 [Solanum dulcamara]